MLLDPGSTDVHVCIVEAVQHNSQCDMHTSLIFALVVTKPSSGFKDACTLTVYMYLLANEILVIAYLMGLAKLVANPAKLI